MEKKYYNPDVLDGTQWVLEFYFEGSTKPISIEGSNAFPYNFDDLTTFLGIEENETEEEESREYLYCQVMPEDINRTYYYISEIPDIASGEIVVIPFGADNKERFGKVMSAETYDEWDAPYPVENTKKIYRKATDEEVFHLREQESEKYVYCYVVPEGKSDGYYYISEIEDLQKGDLVIIPFGGENREIYGKVSFIRCVSEKNAPYPPERTKRILRKVESDNTIYEFITVLPITHKQKTFGYINILPDIQIGDYVEVKFRNDTRIAQVKAKKTGTINQAPNNFMGTMEVLRKLNYENCDYIRFQTELLPLALTGELFERGNGHTPGEDSLNDLANSNQRKPRLTEKAVAAFEKVYQISLPKEYRAFLTGVANGIGGVRGIIGLDVIDYHEDYIWLKYPFRFDALIERAIESEDEMPALEYECDDRNCSECENRDFCPDNDSLDDYGYMDFFFVDGTLEIHASGDTNDRMIVTGKHAGAVIRFDEYMGKRTLLSTSFMEYVRGYIGNI